jgi:PAS domain S-box-containing protein
MRMSAFCPAGQIPDMKFMFCRTWADTQTVGRTLFFTNHMEVLALLTQQPDLRLREVAQEVGITERATHRIISELVDQGYLSRERAGARNRYGALRPPLVEPRTAEVIQRAMASGHPATNGSHRAGAGRFRAIFEAVAAGVVVLDETGQIVAVNREFCRILGRREAELIGRSVRDHTHPDDLAVGDENIQGLLGGDQTQSSRDKRVVRGNGSIAWVNVTAVPAVDPETGTKLIVGHVVETGERRRREGALAEAEERFQNAFDNAPIGMGLLAPDGRWLKVNRALCDITGYSETALLTSNFESITHPKDLEAQSEFIRRIEAGEISSYQMDKRYRHAEGHYVWVSLSVSLVRDPAGEPLYFIAQVKDITRRRAEAEAIRQVVDRIAEAVSIIDADGSHLLVNPASRTILYDLRPRFERGRLADQGWGAMAEDGSPVPAEKLPAEVTRLTGTELDDVVIGFPSASQDIRWLRISTRRLSDGPPPYQVIVSYTDVTRRKLAERALAASQAKLDGLFRYIPAALSLRDLDGRYLDVTDAVARALGSTPENVIGRHPSDHLSPEALAEVLADDEAIRAGSGPISREVRFSHADGTDHDYYVVKWPVLDENGAVTASGAFSMDVTDRAQGE